MSEATFYLEFLTVGNQVKVMAIDPETGIEVSIIANANPPLSFLQTPLNKATLMLGR